MNLRLFVFLLFLLLNEVTALNDAIPYELLWFFSAYKMDYKTHTAGNRKIATGCVHTPLSTAKSVEDAFIAETVAAGVEGICTFHEFIHHVGGADFDKYPRTAAGWTLSPDVAKHVAKVQALAAAKKARPGPNALFYSPNKIHADITAAKVAQETTLKKVLNTAQESRAIALGQSGFDIVGTAETEAKEYLRITRCYRMKDQWRYIGPAIAAAPETAPFASSLKTSDVPILSADKSTTLDTFTRYSIEKTIAGSPSATDAQKNAFRNRVRAYGTTADAANGGSSAKSHQNVLDAVKSSHELISADVPTLGCAGPPTRKRRASI